MDGDILRKASHLDFSSSAVLHFEITARASLLEGFLPISFSMSGWSAAASLVENMHSVPRKWRYIT